MNEHSILRNQRALALLGCLSLERIAFAALPVVRVVVAADVRGFGAAATIQGVSVVGATVTAPLRARILDRVGRQRVIVPQTLLACMLLFLSGVTLITRSISIIVVLLVIIAAAASSPSMDAVIRTLWRRIAMDDRQLKALHSYDSILEECGFLMGPALASVLMIIAGSKVALFVVIAAAAMGYGLTLLSREVRAALGSRAPTPATDASAGERPPKQGNLRRVARIVFGPIADRELQRIVAPLIMMGGAFGVVGILAPAVCAGDGHINYTGFVLAAISAGGIVGAMCYSAAKIDWPLRVRHALLGLVFGLPLLFSFLAVSPWLLGLLLAMGGLAVTPLYINAYLMMDAEISADKIHEANTWVPVGNDVGYVIGITAGAALLHRVHLPNALFAITFFAFLLVAYSVYQLFTMARGPSIHGAPRQTAAGGVL